MLTHPDLEVLHVVDPETGEPAKGAGELVLTQLGLRGSVLVRWRTGDLVERVDSSPDPVSGRTVPRVIGLRRGALVPELALRSGTAAVDLRGVAGALAGRADLVDWRVQVRTSARDGADHLLVHVVPRSGAEPGEVVVGVAVDVRASSGVLPTQVVLTAPGELPGGGGSRVLLHR